MVLQESKFHIDTNEHSNGYGLRSREKWRSYWCWYSYYFKNKKGCYDPRVSTNASALSKPAGSASSSGQLKKQIGVSLLFNSLSTEESLSRELFSARILATFLLLIMPFGIGIILAQLMPFCEGIFAPNVLETLHKYIPFLQIKGGNNNEIVTYGSSNCFCVLYLTFLPL